MRKAQHVTFHAAGLLGILGLIGLPGLSNSPPPAPSPYSDTAPTTPAGWQATGSTHAAAGVLRKGCHSYAYTYVLRPAFPDYGLNTFLIGPHGERLANGAILSGQDGPSGTRSFEICSPTTEAGRYTIAGEVYYYDYPATYSGWLAPSYFHLAAPRHHRHHHHRRHR
jgi:hypothetical protein